jgi:peptide-methionine (S)-S-oxide reductase
MLFSRTKTQLVTADRALGGRNEYAYPLAGTHAATGSPLLPPYAEGAGTAVFGLGCFWGAEKLFWSVPGVITTAAGYSGGFTPHPTYDEVCSGLTGHAEVVQVVFDPSVVGFADLLAVFFAAHDPTQGMRQGNDVGTQYRSAIYYGDDDQRQLAVAAKAAYSARLQAHGKSPATTEIAAAGAFYFAESYHQQYLAKNPFGYCPDHSTGISCPVESFATVATGAPRD